MQCRIGCGACCIAASFTRPFFGMPHGKQAGERCIHLDEQHLCRIFNDPRRPQACADFQPEESVCGSSFDEAIVRLLALEQQTLP